MAGFVVALCQNGAERALVDDASTLGFSRAYSRSGFVTLKPKEGDEIGVDSLPDLIFARFVGVSLGKTDEPPGRTPAEPKDGDVVRTVVDLGNERWAAQHRHGPDRSPFAGALMPESLLPAEAPSRAWLKLEEAARTFRVAFREGQRALEIGSAPGGASWNLLQRGLEVVGVDPNDMDPRVAAHPKFTHLKTTSMTLDPSVIDKGTVKDFDWVLLDVNVPPGTALRSALPFVERAKRGAVLTLKLKSWSIAHEVPSWLRRIRRVVPENARVTARQLSTNGQEICVVVQRP